MLCFEPVAFERSRVLVLEVDAFRQTYVDGDVHRALRASLFANGEIVNIPEVQSRIVSYVLVTFQCYLQFFVPWKQVFDVLYNSSLLDECSFHDYVRSRFDSLVHVSAPRVKVFRSVIDAQIFYKKLEADGVSFVSFEFHPRSSAQRHLR